jgi:hypothetical protein
MAEYADAIGYSLAVWDNFRLPQSYYNNLAWSGGMIKIIQMNLMRFLKIKEMLY